MDGLREPLAPRTRALLRRAVVEYAASSPSRTARPVLHVGVPGQDEALELDGWVSDPGLRVDVVAALRVRARVADDAHLVWLTRSGGLDLQDVDRDWLVAARSAYTEAGAGEPVFVVVNRRGWRDPRSGLGRMWTRIRR